MILFMVSQGYFYAATVMFPQYYKKCLASYIPQATKVKQERKVLHFTGIHSNVGKLFSLTSSVLKVVKKAIA